MGPSAGLESFGQDRRLLYLPEIVSRFLGHPARSLVTTPTVLPRPLVHIATTVNKSVKNALNTAEAGTAYSKT